MSVKLWGFVALALSAGWISVLDAQGSGVDAKIEASFEDSYVFKTFLRNDAIKTDSKNGVVTLTGQVSEPNHQLLAQETLRSIAGVERVENHLGVTMNGDEESDKSVRAKACGILALHRSLNNSGTRVDCQDGVITLSGEATSQAQKNLTAEYAADVIGVLRVTNIMRVSASSAQAEESAEEDIDDASITALVKVALLSHRSTSSMNPQIGTTNGVVTVSGVAKNFSSKSSVTALAADIHGVKSVINNMIFSPAAPTVGRKPAPPLGLRLVSTGN